jgi:uncharacterized membrane protein
VDYESVMHDAVRAFELVGVAILLIGSLVAFVAYAAHMIRGWDRLRAFVELRSQLGRSILLGLEVLVVADIIRTIVVSPTLESALTLGIIVIVRIALSFAIDVEVDGVAPWRKADLSRQGASPGS